MEVNGLVESPWPHCEGWSYSCVIMTLFACQVLVSAHLLYELNFEEFFFFFFLCSVCLCVCEASTNPVTHTYLTRNNTKHAPVLYLKLLYSGCRQVRNLQWIEQKASARWEKVPKPPSLPQPMHMIFFLLLLQNDGTKWTKINDWTWHIQC